VIVRRARIRLRVGIGFVVVVLMSACSSASDGESGAVSELGLAIDQIGGPALEEARTAFIVDCLSGRDVLDSEIARFESREVQRAENARRGFGVAASVGTLQRDHIEDYDLLLGGLEAMGTPRLLSARDVLEAELLGALDEPGCRQLADETLDAPIDGFRREFASDLVRMEQRYVGDPGVSAFWDTWRTCMSAEGYDVNSLIDLTAGFVLELNDISAQVEVTLRSTSIADLGRPRLERDRITNGEITADVEQQLVELQSREQRAAEASVLCGASPVDGSIPAALADVRRGYEDEFLAEHGERVAQRRAEAEKLFADSR